MVVQQATDLELLAASELGALAERERINTGIDARVAPNLSKLKDSWDFNILSTGRALRLGQGRWSRCIDQPGPWQRRTQTTIPQHPRAARFVNEEISLKGQNELGRKAAETQGVVADVQKSSEDSQHVNAKASTVLGQALHQRRQPGEQPSGEASAQRTNQIGNSEILEVNGERRLAVDGEVHEFDDWTNISPGIVSHFDRQLYQSPNHPISITCSLLKSVFPSPEFQHYTKSNPVISTKLNFDNLGIPAGHPGRSKTDTYYVNETNVLRTHTSGYQMQNFAAQPIREKTNPQEKGWTCVADVYRRDAIDRSHYPVFHQMEGGRTWTRPSDPSKRQLLAQTIQDDIASLSKPNITVSDPNPTTHPDRNPLQPSHTADEAEAVATHLKRSLELMIAHVFANAPASKTLSEPLPVRWIEAYFPFTSPSWEVEVYWQGEWLEVLGCGVVKQSLLDASGVPDRIGWAFGLGIERLAMLLFGIPDIRLFWSQDQRFLGQFKEGQVGRFVPFSKHPECYKDVAFWLKSSVSAAGGGLGAGFHENDLMEIVRDVAGDLVEDVKEVDAFTHPKTGRKSLCYRINYRSLERTLTNEEANKLHAQVEKRLVEKTGVEIR